jgi:hypothetical protein
MDAPNPPPSDNSTSPKNNKPKLEARSAIVEKTTHPFVWLDLDRVEPNKSMDDKADGTGGITTRIREMDSHSTPPSSQDDSITNSPSPGVGSPSGEDHHLLNRNNTTVSSRRNLVMPSGSAGGNANGAPRFKTYKRRWFGLLQLVLLNIVVSLDVSDSSSFDSD